MKLTSREMVVAMVAVDLFKKGSPAYRIAKYCLLKKMNLAQVYKLSQKLPSFDERGDVIGWFHRLSERPELPDRDIENGCKLREEILSYGKENPS